MRSDNPSWFSWPFARLWNRSQPNADRPVYIVGPDISQPQPTNIDIAIVPRGTGAISAQVPDGTIIGGNKRGTNAVDLQINRTQANHVASGLGSVLIGGDSNYASGSYSGVLSGNSNGITSNTSVIAGGSNSLAAGTSSVISGGLSNTASGTNSAVSGGVSNTASGAGSVVGGGNTNTANGTNSVIPGGNGGTTRSLVGRLSFSSGTFAVQGDAQYGLIVLRRETTNNTPTILTSTNANGSSINLPSIPATSFITFRVQVVCVQAAGTAGTLGDAKAWDIFGSIKRGASITDTAILGAPTITVISADANLGTDNTTGAIISVTADTSITGALLINVTGETNKTLRWVATVHTTEVDY